jgi:hypothetical protein
VTVIWFPVEKAPVPVGSTMAVYGPAPSVVTMWTVPEIDPPDETWGRVLPDIATTADIPAKVLGPALVFPSPSDAAALELKTVVSTSVSLLVPAPGMTPPWIPRPVVFPPASPVYGILSKDE